MVLLPRGLVLKRRAGLEDPAEMDPRDMSDQGVESKLLKFRFLPRKLFCVSIGGFHDIVLTLFCFVTV